MKTLIVEGESRADDYLRQGLAGAGFVTDLARDGWDGLALAKEGHDNLVILDVMLPGLNGRQVLEGVRRAGDVAVRRLRLKVDEGFELKLIHTVRGMGYVLEAPPEEAAP